MFDGQVVRPPQAFRIAAQDYVCVRITNINEHDLNLYRFDYDLTMAILLANADGTVYHRYGGRANRSPMSIDGLIELMREGLKTHLEYTAHPDPPPAQPPRVFKELVETRLQGRIQAKYGCLHCHYVREAEQTLAVLDGRWSPDQFWIWPSTERLGLSMNQRRQYQVDDVIPGSPAQEAGIQAGDELLRLKGERILTKYDIQWILHRSPSDPLSMPFQLSRNGRIREGMLALKAGWKIGDPGEYQWRFRNVFTEHMAKFLPTPGFIGDPLSVGARETLGLEASTFALKAVRVNYGAYLAGVRVGDVILGAGGKSDFQNADEFYRWCESLRRAGRDIQLNLARAGASMSLMIGLNHLNDAPVEEAPRVQLGFIAQELPSGGGLRVGNVLENGAAERAGLQWGDRIVSVDGKPARAYDQLWDHLNRRSPGDLLTLTVDRNGALLSLGFILPGESENRSDLARLSEPVRNKAQILQCRVSIKLPADKHIYSARREGFGLPTRLEFRGSGYRPIGGVQEPLPRLIDDGGVEPMWILEGTVELTQALEVTDPGQFHLVLEVYAQVCDDNSCHELRSVIVNDGSGQGFAEFRGRFEELPVVHAKEQEE